jgi:hypothetical protein
MFYNVRATPEKPGTPAKYLTRRGLWREQWEAVEFTELAAARMCKTARLQGHVLDAVPAEVMPERVKLGSERHRQIANVAGRRR